MWESKEREREKKERKTKQFEDVTTKVFQIW